MQSLSRCFNLPCSELSHSHRGFSPVIKFIPGSLPTVLTVSQPVEILTPEETVETVEVTVIQLDHRAEAAVRIRAD